MKSTLLSIICLCFGAQVLMGTAVKMGPLPEILKPQMIRVFDKQLFIVQGPEVFIFSLKNLKLLHRFGKKGEGPGEFIDNSLYFNHLFVDRQQIIVNSFNKLAFFSRAGQYKREIRLRPELKQISPFGQSYLRLDQVFIRDKTQYQRLILYDGKFKQLKEIYRQRSGIQPVRKVTDLVADSLNFKIWKNRLYVEKSNIGFVIDVHGLSGQKIHRIKRDYRPLPVGPKYRERAMARFRQDPFVKEIGYKNFLKNVSGISFPDFFPPIQSLDVSGDRIYVRTFEVKNRKEACIVLSLSGKEIGKTYLPIVERAPFLAWFLGVRYNTIHDGFFYYLQEEEDSESWLLFRQKIL